MAQYTLNFAGFLAGTSVGTVVANGAGLTGVGETVAVTNTTPVGDVTAGAVSVAAGAELDLVGGGSVQTLTLGGPTGGNFDLVFDGLTTSDLPYNAPSASVQSALTTLLNTLTTNGSVGAGGNVTVSGANGGPYTITFGGSLANVNDPQLSVVIGSTASVPLAGYATVNVVAPGGNIVIGNKGLTVNGFGFVGNINNTSGAGSNVGAVQSVSGQNAWGTGVTTFALGAASFIGVDSGSTLALNGIVSGAFTLGKEGSGNLEFRGPTANTFGSATAPLIIDQGTVLLNKDPGVSAIAPNVNIVVGDNLSPGTATLEELSSEQIGTGTGTVTVNSNGLWDTSEAGTGDGVTATSAIQTLTITGADERQLYAFLRRPDDGQHCLQCRRRCRSRGLDRSEHHRSRQPRRVRQRRRSVHNHLPGSAGQQH